MSVRSLRLTNFRNYESLELDFDAGLTLIQGANGQGKTNLLEALYLVSRTQLLRGMRDAEAVRAGQERAEVSVTLNPSESQLEVQLQAGVRKRALVNGMSLPRAADLLGRLPSVSASAADLPIVAGEPSDRRHFLDLELSALYPAYLRDLATYKRAVEQRNALLKRAQEFAVEAENFEAWETQMAVHGSRLRLARETYLCQLSPVATGTYRYLGQAEALDLSPAPRDAYGTEDALRAVYAEKRPEEIRRGQTLFGPHRDDICFLIDGREARLYGSQGQQRSAMIALKLATLEAATTELGEPPLLLLDDVFSDLDASRRYRLVEWVLSKAGQTVITCTEAEAAGSALVERADVWYCKAGELSKS